jgi:DNA-binding MarR family transcriptional regulator
MAISKKDLMASCASLGREYSAESIAFRSKIADSADLTALEMECLDFIVRNGSANAGELVEVSGLTSGAITGLIRRLEARNYVSRREDQTDKRKTIVAPNLGKLRKIGKAYEKFGKKGSELLASFSEAELTVLARYFKGMIAIYQDQLEELKLRGKRPSSEKR